MVRTKYRSCLLTSVDGLQATLWPTTKASPGLPSTLTTTSPWATAPWATAAPGGTRTATWPTLTGTGETTGTAWWVILMNMSWKQRYLSATRHTRQDWGGTLKVGIINEQKVSPPCVNVSNSHSLWTSKWFIFAQNWKKRNSLFLFMFVSVIHGIRTDKA